MILDGGHPAEDAPKSLFIACGKANESSGTSEVTAHRVAVEQSRPVENRRQYQIATRDPSKTSGGSGSEPAVPVAIRCAVHAAAAASRTSSSGAEATCAKPSSSIPCTRSRANRSKAPPGDFFRCASASPPFIALKETSG